MDMAMQPTPRMDWSAQDLPNAFKSFKAHTEFMFGGPLKAKSEEEKCNYLMLWVGEKGRQIYSTWSLTEDQRKVLQTLFDSFESYCKPKSNQIYARYKFKSRVQTNETFEEFVTDLKLLVKDCGYPTEIQDDLIRDHIVFGITSTKAREKLINEGTSLTLEKCIDIVRTYELGQVQCKEMASAASTSDTVVHSVKTKKHVKRFDHKSHPNSSASNHAVKGTATREKCGNCGREHDKRLKCPAKGKVCDYCAKPNHFASVCRQKYRDKQRPQKHVHQVTVPQSNQRMPYHDSDSLDFFVDSVNYDKSKSQAFADILIGPSQIKINMKIDSGSQVNILPLHTFKLLNVNGPLSTPKKQLIAYNGEPLKVKGSITLPCTFQHTTVNHTFFVVETSAPPIVGLDTSLALNLIKLVFTIDREGHDTQCLTPSSKETVLSEYSEVFVGIGLLPGECEIKLKPDVTPVVHPPRKVPVALRNKLQAELDRMEKNEIIAKVTEPTDWVNSLVTVEKSNGDLRICLDPKDLNEAILRPHHPMKTLEDILPDLANAKVFSKLDARSGYWGIKLTDKSSYLTTFNTPNGRYRFLRLPFGIRSAQDEFQRRVDECFEGLNGVAAIVDDILVYGRDKDEHDKNLHKVLRRCQAKNIRLNPDKLEIGATEINYFGHILCTDGLKPDAAKVAAVNDMSAPTNKSELETVLGMITYLSKFAPNLSDLTRPMRELLAKDVEFSWQHQQENAFNQIKAILTVSPGPILAYFDPKKEVTLQVDASKSGLGAAILQDGKPVAYASKALTPTEINYAQIEKELFAVLFGCKRFHQYIYGKAIKVHSDHKPLVSIMKKSLHVAPPRLQRMLLQLQKYDISITHIPGKDIPLADTLSRKYMPDTYPQLSEGMDVHVHAVMSNIPISDNKMSLIRQGTESDIQFKTLGNFILNGWPENRKDCPKILHDYWTFRDELSLVDGVILKGQKVVIPKVCRQSVLEKIHTGHMGIEKCLQRARDIIFWSGMTSDIQKIVQNCQTCIERRNSNCKEPMVSTDIPTRPWETVASDLFTWNNTDYVVLVDYYSRFFEVARLSNTRSITVITKLKSFFSRHGIPDKLVSDNGPQYSSQEFTSFSFEWDFKHVTSSPLYPQSNGLAEKTVQTVKNLFSKASASHRDPYLAILEYRNAPLSCGKSPSQLLMSRRLRSILPSTTAQLAQQVAPVPSIRNKIKKSKAKHKFYYDKATKPLEKLTIGETVRIKQNGLWTQAIVTKIFNDRSYLVSTANGGSYRRNRRHLLKTREKPLYIPEFSTLPADPCGKPEFSKLPADPCGTLNHRHHVTPPQLYPQSRSLMDRDVSPTVTPPQLLQTSDIPPAKVHSDENPNAYVTRSGRIVKPKQLLDL